MMGPNGLLPYWYLGLAFNQHEDPPPCGCQTLEPDAPYRAVVERRLDPNNISLPSDGCDHVDEELPRTYQATAAL
jgi:hypothetical protein